ncbi:MAG: hypothetical protein MPK09_01950 [Gammaproteobacteria bacterium]|nr:hypothetical protein [Gammaproteobacteria bacterium]
MKFWGREKAALARWTRRVVRRRLSRHLRLARQRWLVGAFLRSSAFKKFIEKPRPLPPKQPRNKKAVVNDFVPLAVLDDDLARKIGAKSKVLRLTAPVARHVQRRHGDVIKAEDYAKVARILRGKNPEENKGRWRFYSAEFKLRVILDLDEGKNPVLISLYPRGKK